MDLTDIMNLDRYREYKLMPYGNLLFTVLERQKGIDIDEGS